jgi:hypothetical protein
MVTMHRRTLLSLLPMTLLAAVRADAQGSVVVFKDPGCACCTKWVDLLRREGFTVMVNEERDMGALKQRFAIPPSLRSCHSAVFNNQFVVEGHVPVADVKRLLKDRPAVVGLAVPGMPIGSPGMEVEGVQPQKYQVFAFTREGRTSVFASH